MVNAMEIMRRGKKKSLKVLELAQSFYERSNDQPPHDTMREIDKI
jgi:hypothetical protein